MLSLRHKKRTSKNVADTPFKPDAVPSLFPNRKTVNKSVSSNVEEGIKLRKLKVSLFYGKNAKRRLFHNAILRINL